MLRSFSLCDWKGAGTIGLLVLLQSLHCCAITENISSKISRLEDGNQDLGSGVHSICVCVGSTGSAQKNPKDWNDVGIRVRQQIEGHTHLHRGEELL